MALEDRCSPHSASSPPNCLPQPPQKPVPRSPIGVQMSLVVPLSECDRRDHCRTSPAATPASNRNRPTNESPSISFSISNILSERFGGKVASSPRRDSIFRPYESRTHESTQWNRDRPPKSQFGEDDDTARRRFEIDERQRDLLSLRAVHEVYDLSRTATVLSLPATSATSTLLSGFSALTYPLLHEEILNSHKKLQSKIGASAASSPPLGSLCKTVSHIGSGQRRLSPTPSAVCSRQTDAANTPLSSAGRVDSGFDSSDDTRSETSSSKDENGQGWPAWVYCTRYSDRPSSGPRYRRPKQPKEKTSVHEDKRPRTAFSPEQLGRLKREFNENRYLTEPRRQQLSAELGLNEAQIKIWFQNKRAKIKKSSGTKNPLALQLMAQGLYNHTTVPLTKEDEELEMRMNTAAIL